MKALTEIFIVCVGGAEATFGVHSQGCLSVVGKHGVKALTPFKSHLPLTL